MTEAVRLLKQLNRLSSDWPPTMRRDVGMILHKLTHPMHKILAKVPGDSLTERAKRLKVSRQTMYVWLSEKYRPTPSQAKRIAKVTGVPFEHIVDNGFEDDVREAARKKAARLAAKSRENQAGDSDASPKRRAKVDAGEQPEGV